MRITHVVVTDAFAGTERYVSEVGREQAARGHDVVIIGGDPARMQELVTPFIKWFDGASIASAAQSLLQVRHTDILHTHLTAAEFVAVPLARLLRARVISTRHIAAPRGSSTVARVGGRLIARGISLQLAISEYVASCVEPPTAVLHNGVVTAEPKLPGKKVVLVAQRLEPEKATSLAIQAWERSGLASEGWRLRLAGQGAEMGKIRTMVRAGASADSIDLLGQVQDISGEYQQASILLATAPAEPLGLSVIEAMAIGLPVVAAAGGGHLETVGNVSTDFMFPPSDAEAAGRALQTLAGSRARRNAYGSALRVEQQQRFSIDAHVDALHQHYVMALASRA